MLSRIAWYYKWNDGKFRMQGSSVAGVSFGLHASLILEEAYQQQEFGTFVLRVGFYGYEFDADAMTQKNRKVCR